MEQSAGGDRIFAAEAILKRRVRKVSHTAAVPRVLTRCRCYDNVTAPVHRLGGGRGAVFLSPCKAMEALWLANAFTLLATAS